MVLQFILTVVILVMTAVTQGVQKTITAGKEETCLQRRTCAHNSWGWYFFINNVWFAATVLVRLLYNLRWRTWLTGLRVVGPLLAFLTSRKCREFQALCLMACLGDRGLYSFLFQNNHNYFKSSNLIRFIVIRSFSRITPFLSKT